MSVEKDKEINKVETAFNKCKILILESWLIW